MKIIDRILETVAGSTVFFTLYLLLIISIAFGFVAFLMIGVPTLLFKLY